ncbi:NuA4-domain-containing protein [Stipitochalara longipes BDJ]|uniref:Chromatin modification-related protein EAF6 n=1 Tax=Hyaloscypha variabilis (strain UAMH 11265 / GT02V1 / F) TaxID=1149755 RepID=A0A2J6RN25_HYAVF|nr:NuA4-domain-containing protein [Stipitochalara longipes BDJ]PMD39907.1 NuA4-domain-containing protein [Hyaloscypha variabilis F]
MSENAPPASAAVGTNGDVPGQPFYDKARAHLKDLLQKKRLLERSLAQQEETIYKKETDYLEDTPSGNIITGFEAYTKGSGSSAPGQRRRAAVQESNRVFSRSSISYNVNAESPMETAQSTPMAAMPNTPLEITKGDSGSNHATPTSATSANKSGAGSKKNKKGADGEDSELDRETKKVRTNFGVAARK